jgi:hypothetical protein
MMAELYVQRPHHYEAIANTPENADRIRALQFDPITLPANIIIPYCVETGLVEYPLCAGQAEFDERYTLEADARPTP